MMIETSEFLRTLAEFFDRFDDAGLTLSGEECRHFADALEEAADAIHAPAPAFCDGRTRPAPPVIALEETGTVLLFPLARRSAPTTSAALDGGSA